MMRTSTLSGLVPPTGTKVPSCKTRKSLTCIAGDMSATSSRKKVPPSATLNRPGLSRVAQEVRDAPERRLGLDPRPLQRRDFRHRALPRLRRFLVDEEAAGEQRSLPLAGKLDRRADDLQTHVARPEQPRAAVQLAHRGFDALVAAAQPFLVAEAGGADAVLRRNDDALAVIEDEALGIGERQFHAPPTAHRLAELADDPKLFHAGGIDGH